MACNEKMIEIKDYIEYFKNNINQPRPLGVLFKTDKVYYFYDTGTSKILSCEKLECEILQKIISGKLNEIYDISREYAEDEFLMALDNIKEAIDTQDILKAGGDFKFNSPPHCENLHESIQNGLQQITLELTEQCNLRCGYCIYNESYKGKRNFGSKNMSEEIAMRSVDYLKNHGDERRVSVTFYGGEPLVNFKTLRKCVDYATETITDRELHFSMTSNLTLMTPEVAQYIASIPNFSILCSIDGPKEVHDKYRKDLNGVGSFSRAIRGLKYLVQAFGNRAKNMISISMVFAPPYSKEKLDKIQCFFEELDWLPKEVSKLVTYPTIGSVPIKGDTNNTMLKWSNSLYLQQLKDNVDFNFFTSNSIEQGLSKLQKRPIYKNHNDKYPLNGCCIPGNRKVYITVNGDFKLCEKVDGGPDIGNIFDGIDEKKIKSEMIDEYISNSNDECKNCWAARLCSICYMYCYNDGKLDFEKKKFYCNLTKNYTLMNMIFYHECLEANPKKLEYINQLVD